MSVCMRMYTCKRSAEIGRSPQAWWLTILAKLASFRFNERPYLKR